MSYQQFIQQSVAEGLSLQQKFFRAHSERIEEVALEMAERFRQGKKLLVFGNGGSAADAQHMASELVGRFSNDSRRQTALSAFALSTDTSTLTSVSNDFGFEWVFARQIAAHGQEGDLAVAISTSGNSPNVLRAVEEAKARRLMTVALSGRDGGKLAGLVEACFTVEANSTARIQEVHALLIHLLCEIVDLEMIRLEHEAIRPSGTVSSQKNPV
ncbi:MAG: SIS domain-containing protein [Acidobacteriia bacterium]|nr:SIS domain-containing protein [Terriglobia bacterium]